MYTSGFNTESLFTMQAAEKRDALDLYCRLEGMDCHRIISEKNKSKSLLSKIRHAIAMTGHMGH